MERSEWISVVERIQATWPNANLPNETVAIWYEHLKDLPVEQVAVAYDTFFAEGREFPPTAGMVRVRIEAAKAPEIDYGEAWRLVREALMKYAPYEWVKFYDSLPAPVAEAARRFGFENQGGYMIDEEPIVRAQFRDIYNDVVTSHRQQQQFAQIAAADRGGEPKRISDVLPKAIGEEQDDPSGEQEASGDRDPEGAGADDR